MTKKNLVWIIFAVVIISIGVCLILTFAPKSLTDSENMLNDEGLANGPSGQTGLTEKDEIPVWQKPEKPEESAPIKESEVPEEALEVTMSIGNINPSVFEVKGGAKVMISVVSGDEQTHVFKFRDESLKDVAVGIAPREIRVITFYAPNSPGEYEYYCDVPGHAAIGEVGRMIVK